MSEIGAKTPLSIRDAFYKILDNPAIRDKDIIRAEEITQDVNFSDHYDDILAFERDLAQIMELILLFCESEGSLAELGAFALIEEIALRLLVVVRDKHWNQPSFIRLGPLRFLEKRYGQSSIFVLDDLDVNIKGDSTANIDINILKDRLQAPIRDRLERQREPTTFNKNRDGHLIKLIVGLIQDYGALTKPELQLILQQSNIDIDIPRISALLYCAIAVEWIAVKRKGQADFFIAKNVGDAARISVKGGAEKNKSRRRLLVREHWRTKDPLRHLGIREVFGATT